MPVRSSLTALALSAPLVLLPAAAHAEQPVHALTPGCGVVLEGVPQDASLAQVRAVVLPGQQAVVLADEGRLTTRGVVQVPFDLPVAGDVVRVVLVLDGVDQPGWDVGVPDCPAPSPPTSASTASSPGPSGAVTASSPAGTSAPGSALATTSPTGSPATPSPATPSSATPSRAPASPVTATRPTSPAGQPAGVSAGGASGLAATAPAPGGTSSGAGSAVAPLPLLAAPPAAAPLVAPAPLPVTAPEPAAGTSLASPAPLALGLPLPSAAPAPVVLADVGRSPTPAVPVMVEQAPAAVLAAGGLGAVLVLARRRRQSR